MSAPAFRTMTEEQYLSRDGPREGKGEFVDGFVYAQGGASRAHRRISSNIQRMFLNASGNNSCWTYVSALKVGVLRDGRPRYDLPDIVVTRDQDSTGDIKDHPSLIVEILSEGTRAVDESFKASDCRRLPSLHGYLLVDSAARGLEFHRRVGADREVEMIEGVVRLPCPDVTLRVDEVYRGVELFGQVRVAPVPEALGVRA